MRAKRRLPEELEEDIGRDERERPEPSERRWLLGSQCTS